MDANAPAPDLTARPKAQSRPASRPKAALDILQGEDISAQVIRRARWLDTLGRHLHAHLPAPLNQHARLGNIKGETLVYLVDSPIWHTRLRLASAALLQAARAIGLEVNTLHVRMAQQPFDLQARTLATVDARMRDATGTTATEGRTLAELRALLGDGGLMMPAGDAGN